MGRRRFGREFKLEAVKLVRERGVTVAQAARDLDLHENLLRKWVKDFATDPQHAFPGQGQMKPEQLEIERLRREVQKLKAERDILKNHRGSASACGRTPHSVTRRPTAPRRRMAPPPSTSGRSSATSTVGRTSIAPMIRPGL